MLLKCYLECGRLETALELFNKLLRTRTISWNMMIAGCVKHDKAEGAIEMHKQMRNEGGQPDASTYLSVLKASASPSALKWGKDVYGHIISDGLQADARVAIALVQMYAKTGLIADAKQVESESVKKGKFAYSRSNIGGVKRFSHFTRLTMKRYGEGSSRSNPRGRGRGRQAASDHAALTQLQAGSTLKETVTKLMDRVNQGTCVPSYAYNHVLQWCSKEKDLESVKRLHDSVKGSQIEQDPYVANMLLKCYLECGRLATAQELFNKLLNKSTITWNTMIAGSVKHDRAESAIEMYKQMRNEGGQPNAITFLSVLMACARPTALKWGKEIHAHIISDGLQADVRVATALVQMYAKIGLITDAKQVFDEMRIRNVITWNAIIGGLAEQGLGHEAFSMFLEMQREGIAPDAITYVSILNPCSSAGAQEWLKEVHAHALEAGLDDDVRVGTALVQMYAKTGLIADAKQVFDKLRVRDVISWALMIGGLAEQGLGHDAFSLFLEMQREGIAPDAITYVSILNPCSNAGAVEWLKKVHAHASEVGLDDDVRVGTALVQMYAKTGLIADAKQVFHKMRSRDVISWTVMIAGLAQHGHGREALQLFEQMEFEGVKPNDSTFVAVLSACNHAGLVEEGRSQFYSMMRDYGIEPDLEHYTCVVDMLGRAGLLKEAQLFILNMPIKPDVVTWMAFLGACRTHQNVELAKLAATECKNLRPTDAAANVLLSNVYASVGSWDQVCSIRRMMQERGIRKDPGRCSIVVGNKVHDFLVGDTSHPETREIYNMLSTLSEKLKDEGYIPDTRLVLRNIAEEDKESAVCSHSEKLAIAYGLIHVPPGEPIRVYKNLRICTDCHAATKLISKTTGREIVARDGNRFHHFKDGSCSCGDYW